MADIIDFAQTKHKRDSKRISDSALKQDHVMRAVLFPAIQEFLTDEDRDRLADTISPHALSGVECE